LFVRDKWTSWPFVKYIESCIPYCMRWVVMESGEGFDICGQIVILNDSSDEDGEIKGNLMV